MNEQKELWNGTAGRAWVDAQEILDEMFRPFEELLVGDLESGQRVLDVGSGTGATTLAAARRSGGAIGVDVSSPMLEVARARAEREAVAASFVLADAETHAFAPASFDRLISRFGVMFFEDPVAAFANLERAASGDARLRFIAWRGAAENPFMTTAERAAAPLLPEVSARRADGPGQFAFADEHRVQRILAESGWSGIDIRPLDVPLALPVKELERYVTRLGPLGRVLHAVDDATRARVITTVRAAFEPYVQGDAVRFTGACWRIEAVKATRG